jgi:hypothetical protein
MMGGRAQGAQETRSIPDRKNRIGIAAVNAQKHGFAP